MFCHAIRQGPPQIRRRGDDNVGNFLEETVKRLRKTHRVSLMYYHTGIEA